MMDNGRQIAMIVKFSVDEKEIGGLYTNALVDNIDNKFLLSVGMEQAFRMLNYAVACRVVESETDKDSDDIRKFSVFIEIKVDDEKVDDVYMTTTLENICDNEVEVARILEHGFRKLQEMVVDKIYDYEMNKGGNE